MALGRRLRKRNSLVDPNDGTEWGRFHLPADVSVKDLVFSADGRQLAAATDRETVVIEDDPRQVRLYAKGLPGCRIIAVETGTAALRAVEEEKPGLIFLDHQLADGERGTEFLPLLKTALAHVPVILISGTLDIKGQLSALQGPYSAHYLLEKPVDLQALRDTVGHALDECGLAETVRCIRSLERAEILNSKDPERVFAARLARQVGLLKRLRDGKQPNVTHLARELKVSDLRSLGVRRGRD